MISLLYGRNPRNVLAYALHRIRCIVGVHEFRGSGVQGSILIPELHLGYVFTRRALASSSLIQNLEPNWQFWKNEHFQQGFLAFNAVFVINPER